MPDLNEKSFLLNMFDTPGKTLIAFKIEFGEIINNIFCVA